MEFSYKILAEPPSKSALDIYHSDFQYGCQKGTVGVRFPDTFDHDINTLTKEDLIEDTKMKYYECKGKLL